MSHWLPKLDLNTALLFAGLSHALLAMVIFTFWRGNLGRRGGGWWLGNAVLLSVATLILLLTRVLPLWLVLTVSNTLLFFSIPMLSTGLNQFIDKAARQSVSVLWTMGVVAAGLWLLAFLTDAGYTARSVAVTAGLELQGLWFFGIVVMYREHIPAGARRLIQGGLALTLLTCLERLGRLAWLDNHALQHSSVPDALLLTLTGLLVDFAFVCAMLALMHAAQEAELLRIQAQLEQRANTDGLTGVASRTHFEMTAVQWIAVAALRDTPLALLLLDVDRFKEVNDRFGHIAGDQVLRELGALLRKLAGANGLSGRLGGDEFALLVGQPQAEALQELVCRLHQQAASVRLPDGQPLLLSIGAIRFRPGERYDEAYARADRALYDAKHGSRTRLHVPAPVPGGAAA